MAASSKGSRLQGVFSFSSIYGAIMNPMYSVNITRSCIARHQVAAIKGICTRRNVSQLFQVKISENALRSYTTRSSRVRSAILNSTQRIYTNFSANGLPLHTNISIRSKSSTEIPIASCWKCGKSVDRNVHMHFCACGVIMSPIDNVTLFKIMGTKEQFDIDETQLKQTYKDLQRLLHPDKFTQLSKIEREYSESQSSLVNKAYTTLLHPLSRGLYLLHLNGEHLEEGEIQMDPEFLVEIMEINEQLTETSDKQNILKIGEQNYEVIKGLYKELNSAFESVNILEAKETLTRLKYYSNIHDKVQEYKREYGWSLD